MDDAMTGAGSLGERVLEATKRLYAAREAQSGDVTAWVIGAEVARELDLDTSEVIPVLHELAAQERIRLHETAGGTDVQVIAICADPASGTTDG